MLDVRRLIPLLAVDFKPMLWACHTVEHDNHSSIHAHRASTLPPEGRGLGYRSNCVGTHAEAGGGILGVSGIKMTAL